MINEIKVYARDSGADSPRHLLCTVEHGSKFRGMPWFNHADSTDDNLIKAAEEQRDGWKFNGPWPTAVFEMEAFDWRGDKVAI